jgi:hypothetical protein
MELAQILVLVLEVSYIDIRLTPTRMVTASSYRDRSVRDCEAFS